MFGSGLKAEIWRFISFTGFCLLLGLIVGSTQPVMLVGFIGYIIWLIAQIHRLEDWVNQARRGTLPHKDELNSVWSDIAYDIQLMMNRHEKEKQRLRSVVHRVQEMTTALTDGVILIDKRGNIDWWNAAAEHLFEFREIDRGHKLTNLIRHPKFIQYFDKRDYSIPLELTMWRKDQYVEFQVHTFGEGERLVIARDITRLFKLEQMRKDFVANVSHELRTPLTVIQGYVETLSDASNIPKPWTKALQQMEAQCQRMTLLINDLITLTKLETSEKESEKPVLLQPLVETIVSDAKALSGDGQHQFFITGRTDITITGSDRELRSAISNLVVNAINYSKPQSKITIDLQKNTNEVVVAVSDSGIGIDPKHLPRITERFYRVDQGRSVATGGTGLGLAIVKHVLLRHNAELKVTSQPGKGSTFSCHFSV